MKKLLLSSVALFGLTAGAMAADLPRRAAPPVFAAPVPVFTWTGFYIGANAGYGFSGDDHDDSFGFGSFGSSNLNVLSAGGVAPVVPLSGGFFGTGFDDNRSRDGFVGGGQVGFNYQVTPGSGFVFGVEADIQYADFGRNRNDDDFGAFGFGTNGFVTAVPVLPAGTTGAGIGFGIAPVQAGAPGNVALFNNAFDNNGFGGRGGSDWFATVRGRLGYAFDRMMIYATGGVAFMDTGRNRDDGFFGGGFGFGSGGGVPLNFFVGGAGSPAAIAGTTVTSNGFFGTRRNRDDVGFTVGGGVEYAFTNNISLKLEGLYVSFDDDHRNNRFGGEVVGVSNTGAAITRGTTFFGNDNGNENEFFVVRAGINFRFGTF